MIFVFRCAALFQKQMEEGDYKHVEVEGRQYVYPTTMEESVQQRFVRTKPAITDKEQNPSNKLFD